MLTVVNLQHSGSPAIPLLHSHSGRFVMEGVKVEVVEYKKQFYFTTSLISYVNRQRKIVYLHLVDSSMVALMRSILVQFDEVPTVDDTPSWKLAWNSCVLMRSG